MFEPQLPEWKCPGCGAVNQEDLVSCWCCEKPRPETESYADLALQDDEIETRTADTFTG